ncbi:hypothetical protein VNI00_010225 [Paramarasmius palmivorus]|uniref:Cytochrome P450 n=1 Tax=Paramarasmius palmivorus TaxID=297713 RepID=A0AAW0BX85_9AGAR
MDITTLNLSTIGIAFSVFILFYLHKRRQTLDSLNGPRGEGYILGVEHLLRTQSQVGDLTFAWLKHYGPTYRIPGCFGQTMLVTADPRAIHHVLHANVNLAKKWYAEIDKGTKTLDVIPWFHKVTLDVIGESSFNYRFDSLENKPNEILKTLNALDNFGMSVSRSQIIVQSLLRYIPSWFYTFQHKFFPSAIEEIATRYLRVSNEKAREVMRVNGLSFDGENQGTGKEKDVLSVLVKANQAEDPRKRLTEGEVLSQISTLIQAGHHTTGYSLSWVLYEMSRHPEDQEKVFQEIKALSGAQQDNALKYEGMEWLTCCVKEGLRLHPVLPTLSREAAVNDIIPLEVPVVGASGQVLTKVPVSKGQRVIIDIAGYNRLERVWGHDANEWNPSRFMKQDAANPERDVSVGMTGNILSFSGGPKGCIGFRFALMEIHALLAGLIERFEFRLPKGVDIKRGNTALMIPQVKGREENGAGLVLEVKARCS